MPKLTAIEKAIISLEADIAVLQMAVAKLRQQQAKAPVKRPRVVVLKDEQRAV